MLPLAIGGLAVSIAAGLAVAARPGAVEPSGLHGVVYRGPTTPVCHTDLPCEAPAAEVMLSFSRPGQVRKVKTAANGSYRIMLGAGIYSVTTDESRARKAPSPHRIKVRPAHVDKLDFHIDTGIR